MKQKEDHKFIGWIPAILIGCFVTFAYIALERYVIKKQIKETNMAISAKRVAEKRKAVEVVEVKKWTLREPPEWKLKRLEQEAAAKRRDEQACAKLRKYHQAKKAQWEKTCANVATVTITSTWRELLGERARENEAKRAKLWMNQKKWIGGE